MHLESGIVIRRQPEQVWSFLANVANIPKWDRGVAGIQRTTSEPMGVGSEFDTVADPAARDDAQAQGRMSYRIADVDPDQHQCTVQLTSRDGNARFFKTAAWTFRTVAAPGGTLLTCSVDFSLRLRYLLLAPVFYVMKGAIHADLRRLKRVMEAE
jgi:hypothetical protein